MHAITIGEAERLLSDYVKEVFQGDCTICMESDGIQEKILQYNPRVHIYSPPNSSRPLQKLVTVLSCGHTFHRECVIRSLRVNTLWFHRICPTCKCAIDSSLLPRDLAPYMSPAAHLPARLQEIFVPGLPIPLYARVRTTYREGLDRSSDRIRRAMTAAIVIPVSYTCGAVVCFLGTGLTNLCFNAGVQAVGYNNTASSVGNADSSISANTVRSLVFVSIVGMNNICTALTGIQVMSNVNPMTAFLAVGSAYATGALVTWESSSHAVLPDSPAGEDTPLYLWSDNGAPVITDHPPSYMAIKSLVVFTAMLSFMFNAVVVGIATSETAAASGVAVRGPGAAVGDWMGRVRILRHLVATMDVVILVARRAIRGLTR